MQIGSRFIHHECWLSMCLCHTQYPGHAFSSSAMHDGLFYYYLLFWNGRHCRWHFNTIIMTHSTQALHTIGEMSVCWLLLCGSIFGPCHWQLFSFVMRNLSDSNDHTFAYVLHSVVSILGVRCGSCWYNFVLKFEYECIEFVVIDAKCLMRAIVFTLTHRRSISAHNIRTVSNEATISDEQKRIRHTNGLGEHRLMRYGCTLSNTHYDDIYTWRDRRSTSRYTCTESQRE